MNLIENCYSDEVESKKMELFTKETTLKESDDLEYVKTVNEFPDCKENELLEAFNLIKAPILGRGLCLILSITKVNMMNK